MVILVQGGGVFVNAVEQGGHTLRLSIRSIRPEDAGTYTCKARNRLGDAEQSSSLIVQCTPPFLALLLLLPALGGGRKGALKPNCTGPVFP